MRSFFFIDEYVFDESCILLLMPKLDRIPKGEWLLVCE